MASEYLVEYNLKDGDQGYSPKPGVHTSSMGRVHFVPNSEYSGRLVVAVDSEDKQEELLNNGNVGARHGKKKTLVIPTDLLTASDQRNVRAVVLEVLEELGVLSGEDAPQGVVVDEVETVSPINATPGAVELATEHTVDLSTVEGSGPEGRITRSDVRKKIEG